jgi:hypothetical protein
MRDLDQLETRDTLNVTLIGNLKFRSKKHSLLNVLLYTFHGELKDRGTRSVPHSCGYQELCTQLC